MLNEAARSYEIERNLKEKFYEAKQEFINSYGVHVGMQYNGYQKLNATYAMVLEFIPIGEGSQILAIVALMASMQKRKLCFIMFIIWVMMTRII